MATNEELVQLIQSGIDKQANTEALWLQNQGIIHKLAASYARDQFEAEDLVQEAFFALATAAEKYDPEQGASFFTYFIIHCNAKMRRFIAKNRSSVSIPVNMLDDIARYQRILKQKQMETGTDLSDEMLCICLDVTQEKLNAIKIAAAALDVMSLDHIPDDDDQPLYAKIPDPEDRIENVMDDIVFQKLSEKLWKMVEDLNPREKEIIEGIYLQNRSGADIGREWGVSYQRINQIKQRALKKIKNQPGGKELRILANELYGLAIKGTSFSAFQRTWTSSTERAAIRLLEQSESEPE